MKRSASEKPPGFNLAMEIACTLPCEPCRVPMALLCAQFGVSRQQHIRRMLGDAGIDFSANHGGGETPDGIASYVPGDWIITLRSGDQFVCKQDVFARKFILSDPPAGKLRNS